MEVITKISGIDFDNVNELLTKDQCDLSDYLYDPNSSLSDLDDNASDEAIAYITRITTESYSPVNEVISRLAQAIELAKGYDEKWFDYGKQPFIEEMQEVIEFLTTQKTQDLKVLFCLC